MARQSIRTLLFRVSSHPSVPSSRTMAYFIHSFRCCMNFTKILITTWLNFGKVKKSQDGVHLVGFHRYDNTPALILTTSKINIPTHNPIYIHNWPINLKPTFCLHAGQKSFYSNELSGKKDFQHWYFCKCLAATFPCTWYENRSIILQRFHALENVERPGEKEKLKRVKKSPIKVTIRVEHDGNGKTFLYQLDETCRTATNKRYTVYIYIYRNRIRRGRWAENNVWSRWKLEKRSGRVRVCESSWENDVGGKLEGDEKNGEFARSRFGLPASGSDSTPPLSPGKTAPSFSILLSLVCYNLSLFFPVPPSALAYSSSLHNTQTCILRHIRTHTYCFFRWCPEKSSHCPFSSSSLCQGCSRQAAIRISVANEAKRKENEEKNRKLVTCHWSELSILITRFRLCLSVLIHQI